jgi:2-polyprenyl-3-methyl-5-hydroxy-6-metoxy-1,4-benzoquinol methylase
MTDRCDLCSSDALTAVYAPAPSSSGPTVYICSHCGLTQSPPRVNRSEPHSIENIGTGKNSLSVAKSARAAANFRLLGPHLPVSGTLTVLDVGASRGSFALKLACLRPDASIVAVEPNTNLTRDWSTHPQVDYLPARIENIVQAPEQFDLIYSCHTIDRLESPRTVMRQHWRALKPGGLLFVESPNLAFISEPDIVEEFFGAKHLYHFSAVTLTALAIASGFTLVEGPVPKDPHNVSLLLRKDGTPSEQVPADPAEVALTARRILDYRDTRGGNLRALAKVTAALNQDPKRKIAIWGGGKLLSCIIEHGRLDPTSLAVIVDKDMYPQSRNVYGVPLTSPENLGAVDPDIIVLMTRGAGHDTESEARRHAPRAAIETYANLLANAKRA